jgi:hypothetical protein
MVFDPKEIMDVSVFLIKSQNARRWGFFIFAVLFRKFFSELEFDF